MVQCLISTKRELKTLSIMNLGMKYCVGWKCLWTEKKYYDVYSTKIIKWKKGHLVFSRECTYIKCVFIGRFVYFNIYMLTKTC